MLNFKLPVMKLQRQEQIFLLYYFKNVYVRLLIYS